VKNYFIEFLFALLLLTFAAVMFLLMINRPLPAQAHDNPVYESPEISGPYSVNVAFPNLDDYIKATGTKWVDPEVLAALIRDNGRELGSKNIYLISFDYPTTSGQVRRWMNNKNYYPTTLLPLFALGVDVKEIFPGYPVVALGSICHDYRGELCAPQLWMNWGRKRLSIVPHDPIWPAYTRFAVVRYEN